MNETIPIDLPKLKLLIDNGIKAIPLDTQNKQAVLVIGDTGVGKSTIMSFLSGAELVVKYDGLKPTLDNLNDNRIKIGHQKFSETTIPTKVVIDGMAFYDCPGFKDNKGEEYQISNSFFVQRLLDIYQKVKMVLIVDESHISEARADKLPKLVRNLHQAFHTFQDIQDGVVMIINRAGKDNTQEDYHRQIMKMIVLKNQNGYLFQDEERRFLKYLIEKRRVVLFRQAIKDQRDTKFRATGRQSNILRTIKESSYVKSKHINNILSQGAKLSIREFIDEITIKSNAKIQKICAYLVQMYGDKVHSLGRNVDLIINVKDEIIHLAEEIKSAKKENIIYILQRQLPKSKIEDFQQDFASVMFFKAIYDKTATYFSNLINKIYSELSHLLTKLDKKITIIQREKQQEVQKQREVQQFQIRLQKRQQQNKVAMQHCSKMDDLKDIAQKLQKNKRNLIQQIKQAINCLDSVEDQLKKVKKDANNLKITSKQIDTQFQRVQQTYFQKKTIR